VIIELINNITEPLRLPEWTPTLVIVLLAIGFPIVIIFSWIYDVHPEGGIVKTEPAEKAKTDEIPRSSSRWKIASYISFVVIVGLIVLNVLPRKGKKENLEKSIAVLPFINDSPEKENEYFMNGIMEELLIKLQTIEGLRVVSRSTVEQFRDQNRPSIPEIADKLGVNYIVEGSGQKYGNTFTLRIQLIKGADDDHLWARSYEEQLEVERVTRIHAEIAESIADELKVIITPEEKQIIEKIPTTNQTAYDFYQRGREEQWIYWTDPQNLTALDKAEEQYSKALLYDSTFGKAYLGLAEIYIDRNSKTEFLSDNYLDSALLLINKALSYDNTLAEVYVLRGEYYRENGYYELALKEYNKAVGINPNSWEVYAYKAALYSLENLVVGIENLNKAISLNKGREFPYLLGAIGYQFAISGFFEIARNCIQEKLNLDNDSIYFNRSLSQLEDWKGNIQKQEKYSREVYMKDSSDMNTLANLGGVYVSLGQYKKSLVYYEKWLDQLDKTLVMQYRYNSMQRVGYAYWKNEQYAEAEYYFNLQMEYCNRSIELDNDYVKSRMVYYDRAGIYAFRGEREKALDDLRKFNERKGFPLWWSELIQTDQLFESIRNEPEFQQIVRDVEAKYQAEHERVRQWLEENEML
jgi:TolB-like protein